MSFGYHTPESLLKRSDSKDAATTCKGITSTGRACRRALAATASSSPAPSPGKDWNGVLAVIDAGDAAAFFCWQHKDQAENLVQQLKDRSKILPLKQRTSIDTLIERVGVLDLDGGYDEDVNPPSNEYSEKRYRRRHGGISKRDTLPQSWQHIQGPLMSVPEEIVETEIYTRPRRSRPNNPQYQRTRRSNTKASWNCCVQIDDEHNLPPPRRREQRYQPARPHAQDRSRLESRQGGQLSGYHQHISTIPVGRQSVPVAPAEKVKQTSPFSRSAYEFNATQHLRTPTRPPLKPHSSSTSPPNSQTASLLSLIPPHLSPTTTSALLAELSRPISAADEQGYIYIFWLTPEVETSKPDDETASALLDADSSPIPSIRHEFRSPDARHHSQATIDRTAKALHRYASVKYDALAEPRKILLKIGRATNVHRRLSQWTKQCGQNITLIRYYPYQARSSQDQGRRMVPHVHRVERLIHLELSDQRVTDKQECVACGRIHKEWFEVNATKDGVRQVDEVVRRWVGWAENHTPSVS